MTHMEKGLIFIAPEPPGKCELCGAVDETRPYGPEGKEVCYECGMLNPVEAYEQFKKRFAVVLS